MEVHLTEVERLIFKSDVIAVGEFRCSVDHRLFPDSGAVSMPAIVFPRTPVKIIRENGEATVGQPNVVMFYNGGEEYRREAVADHDDECDWFVVDPDIISEILRDECGVRVSDGMRPFAATSAPTSAVEYLEQRRIVDACRTSEESLAIDELVLRLTARLCRRATSRREAPKKAHRELVEKTKELISQDLETNLSLRQVARAVHSSPFHLSRTFRKVTGMRLYEFRRQIRLRKSLEMLADRRADILTVALATGFGSHSHFTREFRKSFRIPPSAYRESI